MTSLARKYQSSVSDLLGRNSIHSGWLKQVIESTFGKSVRRRYGVIQDGDFYLFKDDQSTSASDVIPLSHFKVLEMERSVQLSRWGFCLQGDRCEGKGLEIIDFTVGSERELKTWTCNLERLNYEVTEQRTQDSVRSVPVAIPIQEATATDAPYYADPDAGPSHDNTNNYLPTSVFKWNLDRSAANELLIRCGTPGVYIMRKGRDRDDVISAYLLNEPRHYRIFVENNELFLRKDHPHFRKHIQLIEYYHLNNLPTCHARLETPYRDNL